MLFATFLTARNLPVAFAQQEVNRERMNEVYEEVKTPYKYGLVVAPADNKHKIDCPTVFRENGKWYMTYVVYNGQGGLDGRGYETWLAESDNLLEWHTLGRILSFRDGYWDCNQRGGFPALQDMEWGGSYALQSYKGKRWITYIGGEGTGYEAVKAPLFVGLGWTKQSPAVAHEWESLERPILSIHDKDAQWWESLTQYKSTVYWDKKKTLGKPFVMFYNAGGVHPETKLKAERVGIALSDDMKRWRRYQGNPVFAHEASGTITGDAHIQRIGDLYVMFYFSAFTPDRPYKAYNTFATSYDLVHWTDWDGEDLIVPSKSYDELFAHKSYVVKHEGVVYHFYCAVNDAEQRGIAVATSVPLGRSAVRFPEKPANRRRTSVELDKGWKTWLVQPDAAEKKAAEDVRVVNIPHNWDDYHGCRQLTHGNLHGEAYYTREFTTPKETGRRYFLRLEGVGTYATVWLNDKEFGKQPVGRTTLTLDVTDALREGANKLTLKASHPELISDMPWVCGGCSSEWGFSEGSQPLGIFRPVVFESTDELRIEPFGVHIWNDDKAERVFVNTEIKNYGSEPATFEVVNRLGDANGKQVFRLTETLTLQPGETRVVRQESAVNNPQRWSVENPYLYKLTSMIKRNGKTTDEISTPFGIRTLSWPVKRNDGDGRFFLNNAPVFLNGVCEYEHQFGQSHAFSREQVAARVKQIRAAGFNAFRDAHQPHHLDYQTYWDKEGVLWWTQFSAHVWYDTPEFRNNFKMLLRRWVKERRNSPSLVIWGLQNESTLPEEFARECSDIIREMDPTAWNMRIVTTCNGGDGTDWNVIQNWSGTYGGDVHNYARELARPDQLLNGEYGAWRSIGLHTEPAAFDAAGVWSEERMCRLMETKIRLAEQVRDSVCGQFQWIYSSHDNPGRRQPDEAYRRIDKVGPFNYKGLVTPWEEPLDVYYMYKSNYVPADKEPMVYLVSHTWNDRFITGQRRAEIEVYSNCDSVKLYNGMDERVLLGTRVNKGRGTHFVWKDADIRYNVLRAVGYHVGKAVAEDVVQFDGLPAAPGYEAIGKHTWVVPTAADRNRDLLKPAEGYTYLYRLNCGGDEYTDTYGERWMQDSEHYSSSWAADFATDSYKLSPYQASQRVTHDPVRGTEDWTLFQRFRFGRHKLEYFFPVPNGEYRVELYFMEPWHGTGGSAQTDCEGLRVFDVAINDSTVLDDLDVWAESGHDGALKKVVNATVTGGMLRIHFPEVKAGQAVVCGIAIASATLKETPLAYNASADAAMWKNLDSERIEKTPKEDLPTDSNARTSVMYEAENALVRGKHQVREVRGQKGVFFMSAQSAKAVKRMESLTWQITTGVAQVCALRFKYMNASSQPRKVRLQVIDSKNIVLKEDELTFAPTPGKWRMLSTTTGTYINAGTYRVVLTGEPMSELAFDALEVQ